MIRKKPKGDSLIICLTPLQMLIAERIISLSPNQEFDLLVIAPSGNKKYRYYYQRLSKISKKSLYYETSPGFLDFLKFIKELKLNKLHIKYQNIYLANITSRHIQYIVSKSKKSNIYTFDDGTVNIIQNSLYYSNSKPSKLKRIIWRIIGVRYYMKDIKRKSLIHYTIYDNIPNIINDTRLINLFDKKPELTCTSKAVKIFLGQPLVEISNHYSSEFIRNVVESYHIEYYFPHPREKELPKGNYEVIDSDLVFEDYIVKFLKENPNIEAHVYSFTSSCLLNISQIERVKPNFIYDDYLELNFSHFYSFAQEKLNIRTIKIEN